MPRAGTRVTIDNPHSPNHGLSGVVTATVPFEYAYVDLDCGCGWIAPVLQHTRCLVPETAANEE